MPKIIATKENWIILGYKRFAEEGIKGIIVEKMATHLKVNKSSFYWHFKTKKEFIDEIIAYWVSMDTDKIITEVEQQRTAKKKFEKLIEIAFKKEPHLDFIFFLKRYAIKNKKIKSLIDEIDEQRIVYTSSLLEEVGFSKKDAKVKSILFYKYLIGYHEMIRYKNQSDNYQSEVKKELSQFIKF